MVGKKQQSFLCNSRKQIFIQLFWLRSIPALFVSMARRSNNASPEELIKVLSLLQKKPPQSTFYSMTTEQQIAEKEDLLTEMILLSSRPTTRGGDCGTACPLTCRHLHLMACFFARLLELMVIHLQLQIVLWLIARHVLSKALCYGSIM